MPCVRTQCNDRPLLVGRPLGGRQGRLWSHAAACPEPLGTPRGASSLEGVHLPVYSFRTPAAPMARLVSLCVFLTILLGCCAGSGPASQPPVQASGPLTPGDAHLDLAAVTAPAVRTYRLTVVQGAQRQPFGTLTETVSRTPDGGLVRVQRLVSPRGSQVDSLTSTADLSPRSHYSENPGRTVELRYAPRTVTGTYTDAGAAPVAIADARSGPAFDSNFVDLVARAVPLDPGYEAAVQTYERASAGAEETDVVYTVRVTGREPVAGHEAVVVEFSKGDGTSARLFLDPATREVLRQEAEVAPGVTLLIEP